MSVKSAPDLQHVLQHVSVFPHAGHAVFHALLAGCKKKLFERLFARCWGLVLKRCGGGWDGGSIGAISTITAYRRCTKWRMTLSSPTVDGVLLASA